MDRSTLVTMGPQTAYDPVLDRVYAIGQNGQITVWDIATATFLAPIALGGRPQGIAVSADGRYLVVGNAQRFDIGGESRVGVFRVDLDTLNVTTVTTPPAFAEGGVHSVAITARGAVLYTTNYQGSGWTPFREFNVSVENPVPTPVFGLDDATNRTDVITSPNGKWALVLEGNISNAPVWVYNDEYFGTTAYSDIYRFNLSGFNTGTGSIRNDGMSAVITSSSFFVFNSNLDLVKDLTPLNRLHTITDIEFSADGRFLYVLNIQTDTVDVLNASDWSSVGSMNLGFDARSNGDNSYYSRLSLIGDGELLMVTTASGSRIYDLTVRLSQSQTGAAAADDLIGSVGRDTIAAGAGDDRLTGGAGDDHLDGGAGFDRAIYSGVMRQYEVAATGAGSTYTSTVVGGREGAQSDTLISIEEAVFVDGVISFDPSGRAAQVMRLYDAAFNRTPDQAGLETLHADLAAGRLTLLQLATAFEASAEFRDRFGALSNEQFVKQLYQFTLDRVGDAAGVQNWINALEGGMSRGRALLEFSESQEHRNLTAETLASGLFIPDPEALIIARLYDATFDRLPDVAGLATWRAALESGMALYDIAIAFAASPEFQARYGALSDRAFVEQLYRFNLDREGDDAGVQTWVEALGGGMTRPQLLLLFSESAEHVRLTRDLWIGGVQVLEAQTSSDVGEKDAAAARASPIPVDDFGASGLAPDRLDDVDQPFWPPAHDWLLYA